MIGRLPAEEWIIVVSGLPRSGTSMMMQMLLAGGVELLTDGARQADLSNPRGYYEYEPVKKLKEGDVGWLELARGKAVKVVSPLLEHLPDRYPIRTIFMIRSIDEIVASQRTMLFRNRGPGGAGDDLQLAEKYPEHLQRVRSLLARSRSVETLYVRYRDVLEDSQGTASRIEHFLRRPLDQQAMISVVEHSLYRERAADGAAARSVAPPA